MVQSPNTPTCQLNPIHWRYDARTCETAAPVNSSTALVCCTGTTLALLGPRKPIAIVTTGAGGWARTFDLLNRGMTLIDDPEMGIVETKTEVVVF